MNKQIVDRMSLLSDESLIKIITEDCNEYEAEALEIAKLELEKRNIDVDNIINNKLFVYIVEKTDISVDDIVSFRDILQQVNFSLLEEAIINIYPDAQNFIEDYKSIYDKILLKGPDQSKSVLIKMEKENEYNIDSEKWKIYGCDTQTGQKLNIEKFEWNVWSSFYINKNDIRKIGREKYIALCFCEFSKNGFIQEDNCNYFLNENSKSPNNILNSGFFMKLGWTFKNLFSCYIALIAVLVFEFVAVFGRSSKYYFIEAISEIEAGILLGFDMSYFSQIISKLLAELGLLIFLTCIFSGVLYLYRKVINHERININDFVRGIGKNIGNIIIAGICFSLTFNIVIYIVQYLVTRNISNDNLGLVFVKLSIEYAVSLFYIALVVYGTLILAENRKSIKKLFSETFKFIFSKEAVKLFVILLLFSFLYEIIDIFKRDYIFDIMTKNDTNMFGFMGISKPGIPNWVKFIEMLAKTFITSFILLYSSLIFYWNKRNKLNKELLEVSDYE